MRAFSTQDQLAVGYSQQVLLNYEGHLVLSCNTIFSIEPYLDRSFLSVSPFLESIFPVVRTMTTEDPALHFPKVETDLSILPGTYDFYFSKMILEEGEYILWSIYDYTKVYEDFRRFQQRRNELQVHRQLLAFRLQELKRQKDLLQLDQAFNEEVPSSKETIQQLENPLKSPFNLLDGFNWMLSHAAKEPTNYLHSLEDILQHLMENLIGLQRFLEQQDWTLLHNSLVQEVAGKTDLQWEIPMEVKAIPTQRIPYLGVIMKSLVQAFMRQDWRTRITTSLDTTAESFEKGGVRLDVLVEEQPSTSKATWQQRSILQVYLFRSLIQQAGGLLNLHDTKRSDRIQFTLQLPVKNSFDT